MTWFTNRQTNRIDDLSGEASQQWMSASGQVTGDEQLVPTRGLTEMAGTDFSPITGQRAQEEYAARKRAESTLRARQSLDQQARAQSLMAQHGIEPTLQ